jgi:serine/threonine protein phosphatase 1
MTPPHRSSHHWVIGDIHGCADALLHLVEQLPPQDRLILCGDVINRGPAIARAMELAWELVQSGRAVWLRGNHEAALADDLRRNDWQALRSLAGCDTFRQLGERRCRSWLERLDTLPLAYWGQGWVATHAGFDPLSWQPHLSIRLAFWHAYDGRFGDVVVGHTPGPGIRRVGAGDAIVLIDTGACYGGDLTAYCPETRQSVAVRGLEPSLSALASSLPSSSGGASSRS